MTTKAPRAPTFDNDTTAPCGVCGKAIPWPSYLLETFGPKSATCDACLPSEPTKPRRKLKLPPLFEATDETHPNFPRKAWGRVAEYNPRQGKGVIFYGETGGGKSRLMAKLAGSVYERHRCSVRIFWSGEFQVEAADHLRNDRAFSAWRRTLQDFGLVCFDDLFHGQMSERAETALFDILDQRIRHQKPVVVTTQKLGEGIVRQHHDKLRAKALVRRLEEFCEPIVVPPPGGRFYQSETIGGGST